MKYKKTYEYSTNKTRNQNVRFKSHSNKYDQNSTFSNDNCWEDVTRN